MWNEAVISFSPLLKFLVCKGSQLATGYVPVGYWLRIQPRLDPIN